MTAGWRAADPVAGRAGARAVAIAARAAQSGRREANPPRHVPLVEQDLDLPLSSFAHPCLSSNRFHAPMMGQRMCRRSR